jgi:CCR4-NOT transcription complex subunit 3
LEKIKTTPTQREKFEVELKKEIKKLQRLREQVRAWITGNDFKDKTIFQEYRRKIEIVKKKRNF